MASNGGVPSASVWVQVYYQGETKPVDDADPFEIETNLKNVNDLKKKVHEELKLVSRAALCKAYHPGTAVPIPEGTKSLDPGEDVPADTTSKKPMIVIAPKPQELDCELRCCSRILVFNVLFEYGKTCLFLYWKCALKWGSKSTLPFSTANPTCHSELSSSSSKLARTQAKCCRSRRTSKFSILGRDQQGQSTVRDKRVGKSI
jgi:hypothetical protein